MQKEQFINDICYQTHTALCELLDAAKLNAGDVLVVGCSSSEITGSKIGTASSTEAAQAVLSALLPVLRERGIALAAQCCEHLNRALIVEHDTAKRQGLEIVHVIPQPKAGGAFASAVYAAMVQPVAVEEIRADAGMDIGHTMIGMHLKRVAVPVRVSVSAIGHAPLVCARTRPKYIGGPRAMYGEG